MLLISLKHFQHLLFTKIMVTTGFIWGAFMKSLIAVLGKVAAVD